MEGEGSLFYLCQKNDIANNKSIRMWVSACNAFGADGLMRSRKKQTYSLEFKLHISRVVLNKRSFVSRIELKMAYKMISLSDEEFEKY